MDCEFVTNTDVVIRNKFVIYSLLRMCRRLWKTFAFLFLFGV